MSDIINTAGIAPELTKSVEEFIELGVADDITYENYSILAAITANKVNIRFPENNVIYDYIKELKSNTVVLELSDIEYIRYRYNPKRLAYDIYGSTEVYFILLAVNGMCSFKDFNKKKIKVLYKNDMNTLLTAIYNAESDYISRNREKLNFNE